MAALAFSKEGLSVSLDEIARLAGVGAGTVHRHFATKESLIAAVIERRIDVLLVDARGLANADDPGEAFFDFFARLVVEGAASHALAAGLAGSAIDVDAVVASPVRDLMAAVAKLLARAQRSSAVRKDLRAQDLPALLAGAHAIEQHPAGGTRGLAFFIDGLRAPTRR